MIKYKINLAKLKSNYEAFSKFGAVYFSIKTNYNSTILKELKKLGCVFEADSVSHIKKCFLKIIHIITLKFSLNIFFMSLFYVLLQKI